MATKKTLTQKQKDQLESLAVFLTQEQIADYFGISKRTFNYMRERDEEIDAAYRKGKASAIVDIAGGLYQEAMKGNLGAQIFYLKTQAGWRETNRVEIESTSDKPTRIILEPAYESKDTDTE